MNQLSGITIGSGPSNFPMLFLVSAVMGIFTNDVTIIGTGSAAKADR